MEGRQPEAGAEGVVVLEGGCEGRRPVAGDTNHHTQLKPPWGDGCSCHTLYEDGWFTLMDVGTLKVVEWEWRWKEGGSHSTTNHCEVNKKGGRVLHWYWTGCSEKLVYMDVKTSF